MSLGQALILIGLLAIGALSLWMAWPDVRRREREDDPP